MYSLFNEKLNYSRGTLSFPDFDYTYRQLSRALDGVVKYCRTNPTSVSSSHFLVKLIESVSVSSRMDVEIYRDRVEELAEDLAMSLNLTSSLFVGKLFEPGVFYGTGSKEILISYAGDFRTNEAVANWEDLQPCRFLIHPKSDLGFDVPKGKQNNVEEGVSVILIDIPMLMVQYRMWRERERKYNPDNQRTVMQFVSMYVLPNMLESQFHIALFNRLRLIKEGRDRGKSGLRKPYFLSDYDDRMDKNLTELLKALEERPFQYDQILENIEFSNELNMRSVIRIPEMAKTRQVTWALTVARIPVIRFLISVTDQTAGRKNGAANNVIRREVNALLNDKSLYSVMGREEYRLISDVLKKEILPNI